MPSSSPHYQDPRFARFCEACAYTRSRCPTLTLSALRTFLTVAERGQDSGISYDEIARRAGIDYIQAAHHLEQLSDGRARHDGLEIVVRREEADRRYRTVTITDKGADIARKFVLPEIVLLSDNAQQVKAVSLGEALNGGPLPAIQFAAETLPGLALGTLTVLLEIARQEAMFGFDGMPAKTIAEQLGMSNFARHLSILSEGQKGRDGLRLIECIPSPSDRRVKLPRLTAQGHRVVSAIAARVCEEAPVVPRRAKPEKAVTLASPDMISTLDDADFDFVFDVNEAGDARTDSL